MYPASKAFIVLAPAAKIDNASGATNVIDRSGFEWMEVLAVLGDTDIALTALKLQEADAASDATTLTNGADVPGSDFGGTGNPALPADDDDNKIFKWEVDLRGRKKFIKPVVTVGDGATGAFVTIIAVLHRAAQVPVTAAEKGVAGLIQLP